MSREKVLLLLIIFFAFILRVWKLTEFPAGFNADEASIGYNAYSILLTGKDEYGTPFPLIFKSFGDYKPGLYFYIVLPFVAVLGLTELAVRLPSALFGVGTIFLIYLIAKEIFQNNWVGLFSALLLSISPWHIHFSRGGWETNVATFFMTLGVLFLIKGKKNFQMLFFSILSFLASMYTYQTPRLIVPIFLIVIAFIYNKHLKNLAVQIRNNKKMFLIHSALLILLFLPLSFLIICGLARARFAGLSLFSDQGPISRVNELRGEHTDPASLSSILFHNKLTAYIPNFLGHYLDHFNPDFLFINGDQITRNKIPETGQFYLIESAMLIIAIYYLIKIKNEYVKLLVAWILVGPLASSITFQTPHSLRALNIVVPLTIIVSLGLYSLVMVFKGRLRILIVGCLISVFLFEFVHYLESYYTHYPKRYPLAWEYGFKQMVSKLEQYEKYYDKVVITDRYDQPYILLLFFKRYDPVKYQPYAQLTERDKFNFGTVISFDKYEFRKIEKGEIVSGKNILYIGTSDEIQGNEKILDQVNFPNGQPAFIFRGT